MRILSLSRKGTYFIQAAAKLKVSTNTITKAITILEKSGMVTIEEETGGRIKGTPHNDILITEKGRDVLVLWVKLCKELGEEYTAYLC
jgi:DNA-binding transcriptional regulator YhcF (GntR family)